MGATRSRFPKRSRTTRGTLSIDRSPWTCASCGARRRKSCEAKESLTSEGWKARACVRRQLLLRAAHLCCGQISDLMAFSTRQALHTARSSHSPNRKSASSARRIFQNFSPAKISLIRRNAQHFRSVSTLIRAHCTRSPPPATDAAGVPPALNETKHERLPHFSGSGPNREQCQCQGLCFYSYQRSQRRAGNHQQPGRERNEGVSH